VGALKECAKSPRACDWPFERGIVAANIDEIGQCIPRPLSAVRVADGDHSPLFGLTHLERLELPLRFSRDQFAELARRRPGARGAWLRQLDG
jgi:hypothetical protein